MAESVTAAIKTLEAMTLDEACDQLDEAQQDTLAELVLAKKFARALHPEASPDAIAVVSATFYRALYADVQEVYVQNLETKKGR
jgi:DNA-binding GntR family transcriptional regulator